MRQAVAPDVLLVWLLPPSCQRPGGGGMDACSSRSGSQSLKNPEKRTMLLFLGAQVFNKEWEEHCSQCRQPLNEELGLQVDLLSLKMMNQ